MGEPSFPIALEKLNDAKMEEIARKIWFDVGSWWEDVPNM